MIAHVECNRLSAAHCGCRDLVRTLVIMKRPRKSEVPTGEPRAEKFRARIGEKGGLKKSYCDKISPRGCSSPRRRRPVGGTRRVYAVVRPDFKCDERSKTGAKRRVAHLRAAAYRRLFDDMPSVRVAGKGPIRGSSRKAIPDCRRPTDERHGSEDRPRRRGDVTPS